VTDDPEALARQVMDRIRNEAAPRLLARTVSVLVEEPPGALTQHGTAVLLAIADSIFVVSAAHVLNDARYHPLWINPVANHANLIPLERVDVHSTSDDKLVDFSFFKVPEPYATELVTSKICVRLDEIEMRLPSGDWYAVLGYPTELNVFKSMELTVPTVPMYYATRLHDAAADPMADFDPKVNIALKLALYGSGDPVTRTPSTLPDVRGMSGAGIWQLHHRHEPPLSWTVDRIRLAGMFHTRAGKSGLFQTSSGSTAIVGVHFAHVVRTIRKAFPDLSPAIAAREGLD